MPLFFHRGDAYRVSSICFQKTGVRRQKTDEKTMGCGDLSVLCFLFSVI
jgi:hypothetical protein